MGSCMKSTRTGNIGRHLSLLQFLTLTVPYEAHSRDSPGEELALHVHMASLGGIPRCVSQRAHHRFNPLKERELELRGFKIPAIENLAVVQDQFDCIDFSDNEIRKVDNLPRMRRLTTLLFNNNYIRIICSDLGDKIPNLHSLVLTNNRIANLCEVDHVASCQKLELLSLVGNPVVHIQNYRLYVIHKIPSLKHLDFRKVKIQERKAAQKLFSSSEGKALEAGVVDGAKAEAESSRGTMNGSGGLTEEQKQQIKDAISSAQTPEEVDRIERQLRAGTFPFAVLPAADEPMTREAHSMEMEAVETERLKRVRTHESNATRERATAPEQPSAAIQAAGTDTKPAPMQVENVNHNEAVHAQTEAEEHKDDSNGMQERMDVEPDEGNGDRQAVPESEAPPSDNSDLDIKQAKKFKVPELKAELARRGLSTDGLKIDLQNRLFAVLKGATHA